ncbi:MAG: nucleoid-associated protein [Breznakibacter sp.]
MIDFSQVTIDNLVIHQIGCKADGEPVRYSKSPYNLNDDEEVGGILIQYFFKPFKSEAYFNFSHSSGEVGQNAVFRIASNVFGGQLPFYDATLQIADLLYQTSGHPMIKGGEFYMARFRNCVVDGEIVEALGIFKSENKETFLKVYLRDQNFELGAQEGINVKKLDKGCLIFSTEQQLGFKVCSIDNINKGNDAHFWHDDFLGLKPREDNYYFTNNYLKLCRDFVDDVYNEDNDVARAEQIDMLNRSIDFFNKKDNFSEADFAKEVIRQPEVLDAFNEYKSFFESEKALPLKSEFDISKSAVKGEKRFFKSVLKLDKNFHVYVHGKKNYIEKGYDPDKGLNFYKLYFEVEH